MGRWKSEESKARSVSSMLKGALDSRDRRWRGRHSIPLQAHPLIRRFFRLVNKERATFLEIAKRAGCHRDTFKDWRSRSVPNLPTFEAALNAMGYRLDIVKNNDSRGVQ